MAISSLEDTLALELFDRSSRKPKLTPAGKALLEKARFLLRDAERFTAQALAMSQDQEQVLTLAVDNAFDPQLLLAAIDQLEQDYPQITLQLYHSSMNDIPQLVSEGKADLGLGHGEDLAGNLAFDERAISHVYFTVVVSRDHPLAQLRQINDDVAGQYRQIAIKDRSDLATPHFHAIHSTRLWYTTDLQCKLQLIRAGKGWGRMPIHMVEPYLASGELVKLDTDFIAPASSRGFPIKALWLRSNPPGPVRQQFIELLRAQAQQS